MKIKYLIAAGILVFFSCAGTPDTLTTEKASDDIAVYESASLQPDSGNTDAELAADIAEPELHQPLFVSTLPEHFRLYLGSGFLMLPEPLPPQPETDSLASGTNQGRENANRTSSVPPASASSASPAASSASPAVAAGSSPFQKKTVLSETDLLTVFPDRAYKSYLSEDVVAAPEATEKITTTEKQVLTRPMIIKKKSPESGNSSARAEVAAARVPENTYRQWNKDSLARVVLPGRNWYFISVDKPGLVSFDKRFLDENSTVFRFVPVREGSLRLFFRRQDLLNEKNEEKYIDVLIGPKLVLQPSDLPEKTRTEKKPPAETAGETYAKPAPEKKDPEKAAPKLVIPDKFDLSIFSGMTKDEILKIIAEYRSKGLIANAIALASFAYTDLFPDEFNDDLLWILGQLYEQEGSCKDLRKAIHYYGFLVELYPFSIHFKDARGRVGYLERFHIYFK